MKILNLLSTLALACSVAGCGLEDEILADRINLDMHIEQSNSDHDFVSTVEDITTEFKTASWRHNADGTVDLSRKIHFDVTLKNGEHLEFEFSFIKNNEDAKLLSLVGGEWADYGQYWEYESTDVEFENFYSGFDYAIISINNNWIRYEPGTEGFEVTKVKEVTVGRYVKSYITLEFSGTAYGLYDPEGEYSEVYSLIDGTFKGIIE
ncbi:MAG TPA: hypothetical protein DCE41_35155 [Cytophagales bacterium]|nr:hypothetical protein [Cytophagales bacterium]HAA20343.1 hypothetical protein [Cytophagales bacterium]HAP60373.1 hypothetical protein [Cytophagales bacterium]